MHSKMKTFVAAIIACFILTGLSGAFPVSASPAAVTVDAANVLRTIDKRVYGAHTGAWHEMVFDKGVLRPIAVQRIQEMGLKYLNYPGGGYGNSFIWNQMNLPTEMNTDQFIALCQAVGAEPRICVNLNQPAQLAADWVRYCNIEHNYNVKYWGMHDEPYYYMNAATYTNKVNEFAAAMKAVDPTIKIHVCIAYRYPGDKRFTETVIKGAWQNIDVLNHNAFFRDPGQYNQGQEQAYYNDILYNTPGELKTWLDGLKAVWKKYAGTKPVEIHVGSFNSISYYPEAFEVNFLPQGLWVMDILGTLIREDVTFGGYWCLMNPYPPGQSDYGLISPEFEGYVAYDAYKLASNHFGDKLVSSSSDTVDVSAYASISADGTKLYIWLINKQPATDIPVTFTLQNFSPQSTATAWILDGPTFPAHVYDYSIRTETISGVASTFTWTVPSYSAVAIELTKSGAAVGGAAVETTSAGSVDVVTTDAGTLATNLALGKPTYASSSALKEQCQYYHINDFGSDKAVDGDSTYTRWASKIWWETSDYPDVNEYFVVDLQSVTEFNKIVLKWCLWATTYDVYTSNDNTTWTKVADQTNAVRTKPEPQPIEEITFSPALSARFIKVYMKSRPSGYEYLSTWTPHSFSLWEFEAYAEVTPPPGVMHVASIDMSGTKRGQTWTAHATVTIVDDNNAPVEGATVYGHWSGAWTGDVNGVTGSDGKVTLDSGGVRGGGTFTFTVTNIAKTGWTYDPNKNVETSDTITLPPP